MPNIPQDFPFQLVAAGPALERRLDARCWGLYVSNYTAQWVEIADANEFVPPNTRQVISLPGILTARARFAAPPGIAQPIAVAKQTAILTFTEREVQPSGGVVGATALASQVTLERFLRANIPVAGNTGRLIELTDYNRALWLDNGTTFAPITGEEVRVSAWDALGDGVTDDTVNIHKARDAAGVGGVLIFEPNKTYLTAGLTASVADQEWRLPRGSTIKMKNAGNATVINVTASGVRIVSNGGIVDGNKANQAASPARGIFADNVNNVLILGIIAQNCRDEGIRLSRATKSQIVDCEGNNCALHGIRIGASTDVVGCSDVLVRGCRAFITDGTATSTGILCDGGTVAKQNTRIHIIDCISTGHRFAGIQLNGVTYSEVVGCTAELAQDIGIDLEFCDYVTVSGCGARACSNYNFAMFQSCTFSAFVGCVAEGAIGTAGANGVGIYVATNSDRCLVAGCVSRNNLDRAIYCVSARVVLSGNMCRGNPTGLSVAVIELLACSYSVVSGNHAEDGRSHGILLNASLFCAVTGNSCLDNGRIVDSSAGIQVAGTSTDNTITGNVCTDQQGVKTQAYGIQNAAVADARNVYGDNVLNGNLTAPFNNPAAATTLRIYGNVGYNPAVIAAPAVPATTVAATNTFGVDASVYIAAAGGSAVTVAIGGVGTGLVIAAATQQMVRVPANQTITLTYPGAAPTWTWYGD